MDNFSFISNAHPGYIESLYNDYLKDNNSVDPEFKEFFQGFEFALANFDGSGKSVSTDEFKVLNLIHAYRNRGHLIAKTNPLKERKDRHANLSLEYFGLSDKDLPRVFNVGEELGLGPLSLEKIIEHLQDCYCKTLGFEYNYIREKEELAWFRSKIENNPHLVDYSIDKKEKILRSLNKAVVFEQFLGRKFIGEKRFSLEGGETAIPALEEILNVSADNGAEEVVIGMAHRGRLNVLANLLGKTYEEIFSEFEGNEPTETMGDGDVKYHLGFHSLYKTDSNKEVYLKLSPNPSHLEAVDSVVLGYCRSQADAIFDSDFNKILPIIIHGDAAIAGQGVVYEVLQMCKLKGYYTGGTIHFVINNQIGFTTDFDDARSSDYCTSIAATTQAPVIHVNGDEIESVIYAAQVAAEYRQKFNKDIFVDMVCYRRHGHNESDDPKYTQPSLYNLIAKHENPRDIYSQRLAESGKIGMEVSKRLDKEFWDDLQKRLDAVKEKPIIFKPQELSLVWQKFKKAELEDFFNPPKTAISKATAKKIVDALCYKPEGFHPLKKVEKYLQDRRQMMAENRSVDWAAAELMAYGALLVEGNDVRMSGQDVKRGTFSHRHAVIFDENTNQPYNRLSEITKEQGRFMIYNSHLSEYAVLGFEYGYSLSNPNALVLWEAQFGDFANNCQVIIDQFIASAETKWFRNSGLVMLLPHGYEGQGPEHSSARLERYLQLCAELNMVVVNITSPANFFHAIRRQVKWNFRKPLVVMSPKSLLRHPLCQDPIEKILDGQFQNIIDDETVKTASSIKKVVVCSGRLYYSLLEYKNENNIKNVALVRLEQLYPLDKPALHKLTEKYKSAKFAWVQEEPANMGALTYLISMLGNEFNWEFVSRKSSASPATGFKKQHQKELDEIIDKAFKIA